MNIMGLRDSYKLSISIHERSWILNISTYIVLLSFVDQAIEQVLGKVLNICNSVSERNIGIIAISHHSGTFDLRWEVISKPVSSCLLVGPRIDWIAIQTVYSDDTATKISNRNL